MWRNSSLLRALFKVLFLRVSFCRDIPAPAQSLHPTMLLLIRTNCRPGASGKFPVTMGLPRSVGLRTAEDTSGRPESQVRIGRAVNLNPAANVRFGNQIRCQK